MRHSWYSVHDDVIKWKHFPHYWPFVRGIHRSPVNSPHKGQWRRALVFSLRCARIYGWVNNGEAGDLRRHHAHYDVSVMATINDLRRHRKCWYSTFTKKIFVPVLYSPVIDCNGIGGPSHVDVWHSHLSTLLSGVRCYGVQNGCQTKYWSAWEPVVQVGLKSCCITIDEKVRMIFVWKHFISRKIDWFHLIWKFENQSLFCWLDVVKRVYILLKCSHLWFNEHY